VVTTDAFPDRKYDGQLVEISPIANRQKATVQVKVQILHPDDHLRPDMNATVAFVDAAAPRQQRSSISTVTIPAASVRNQSVFVVSGGKAVRRHVQVSGTASNGVRVAQGLTGGEDLILNPPPNLKDGDKVRIEGDHP
jgi:HlyD family secretion protein